jgi:hypothetical protein
MQRVWAVAIALGASACFAVFLRFQSGPWSAVPSFVPVAGVAGFLLYLLEMAYLIYLRGGPPPGSVPPGRRSGGDAPARGAVGSPPPAKDREPFWRWGLRGAAFPVGAMLTAAPLVLLTRALHEWVDAPRCRRLCEAAGFTFDALLDGKHYACLCIGPQGPHTFGERPDLLGGHSWALLLAEDGARLILYLIAFGIGWVFFRLPWTTKWGSVGRSSGTEAGPSDPVSAHAIEIGKREPAGTWVLVVDARYLPHGGRDWIVLTLRAEGGGFIERRRAPERRPPMEVKAPLSPEVSQSIRAQLAARGVWQMRDQLEPVLDGLHATFAFAVDGHVQCAELNGGARSVSLAELLRFVADLAPLPEP